MAAITKHQDPAIASFDPSFAPAGNGSEHSELQTLVEEQQTALETMDNLFDALSEPNRAMQNEHAKTASAFQRFMEKTEQQMEAQSKQIANLQEQLHKEQAYSAELANANEALMQKVEQLMTEVRTSSAALAERMNTLEGKVNAVNDEVATIKKTFNEHCHGVSTTILTVDIWGQPDKVRTNYSGHPNIKM